MYFDIGANIGKWSLSNLNNCDKIISNEASPTTFQRLLSNINNNIRNKNIKSLYKQ
jgi:FkbM family methyltransferase